MFVYKYKWENAAHHSKIFIWVIHLNTLVGDACGITVIAMGIGLGYPSSIPKQYLLHFT